MVTVYIKKNQFVKDPEVKWQEVLSDNNTKRLTNVYLENGFTKIEMNDSYSDCQYQDFNEDLTFNLDKYNARKQALVDEEYENKIVALIRKKYNVNQELAILRQRDTKPEEFAEYNEYVEQCKVEVKNDKY